MAINSADDERNPPETGTMQRELKRVKNGKLYLIPASEETRGHGNPQLAPALALGRSMATLAQPSRDRGTELQHPAPHRFI